MITGAAGTIGSALLRRLWADPAWAGVRFYLLGRDAESLQALAAEGRSVNVDCEALGLDMLDEAACTALIQRLGSLLPLGGLALVAGACRDRSVGKLDEEDWDQVWQVNTGFHARLLAALAKPGHLTAGARGILVGSIVGSRGNHGQSAYAASKGALIDLLPFAPAGLRLNILLPPLVPSPMLAGLSPEAHQRLFKSRLLDDPDPAQSCAEAGAFLLSNRSSYMHRQLLHADSRVGALGWD